MGARSRGRSFSFLIVIFGSFFFTLSLAYSRFAGHESAPAATSTSAAGSVIRWRKR
jgi:hypothetical protein